LQKHRIIEKEYIALTDEIMQFLKEKKLTPKDFVVNGMKIGTTSKIFYTRDKEKFFKLRGTVILQLCKILDKKKKGKYFEKKLRKIFDRDKQFFFKWRKELRETDEVGSAIATNSIRQLYTGENEFHFSIAKMIQLLDYINDLEIEAQRKKEEESGSKKVNKARSYL
jgi:hypothetical protein